MQKTSKTLYSIGALAFIWMGHAESAPVPSQGTWSSTLLARDITGQPVELNDTRVFFVYDQSLNITWLADANYANTTKYITGAGRDVTIHSPGTYGGGMSWSEANEWAENLSIGRWSDWRLPTTAPRNGLAFDYQNSYDGSTDIGLAKNAIGWGGASQMGHLYYVSLGNQAWCIPVSNYCISTNPLGGLTNSGPFRNMIDRAYWTNLEYAPFQSAAWHFAFEAGAQGAVPKNSELHALAIRDGDVYSSIPSPGGYALLATGLIAMLISTSKRKG